MKPAKSASVYKYANDESTAAMSSTSGSTGPHRTTFEANMIHPRAFASIERPASSSPTVISLASASPRPLPRGLRRAPARQIQKPPGRPRRNDRCDAGCGSRDLAVLRQAFDLTGVEFIGENGGGPGVRLPLRRIHHAAGASDRSCFMTFETDS